MNEEPIEIKFVINSPEVLEQAMQLENSLKGVDSAVSKSEKNFDSYVKSQLDANLSIAENIKLTDAQKRAFETYTRTISGFHEMMKETTDPTYIAMYQYKIEEAIESVNRLTSREKSELIDTAKLEEAGRLLDSISDKTFTPDFASNKELELLSERINGAKDEFEQLGVVLDFVQAKIGGISDKSTFDKINTEIQQANDLLGRNVQQYDATGNSIAEMTDALKLFQEKLASETDEEKIKQLNANIEELENNIKRLSNIGKTGFDELGNKIVEQTEQAKGLKGQLADLVQQLAKLRMEGKANTDQYAELSRQATSLRGAISLVNEEISQSSSTTSGLDTLIRATKGIASGYAIAKSASSLFGKDQKDVEQAILKVTSAMSLLQGLQVIQSELLRKEGLATKSLTYLKSLYNKTIGESTGAMKAFKVALLGTGIGVFIVLLGELIANWDKVKRSIGLTSDELERTQAIGKKANDLYGEQIAKLRMLAATNKEVILTDEQKKKAVKDFNKEFGDTLGTAKDYADLEDRIIKNAPKYIEYLQLKAQAEASYMLSLEKQKNLLEQITALSTGDLKWYDKLQDYSDKAFEGIYKLLGIDIGETKREITQSEILHIIGLPDEEQFNEALKGYSSVVQGNLKKFREQQQRDSALFQASFDLQEQAGKMAQAEGIKSNDKEAEAAAKKAFQDKVKALADIAKAENEFEKNRLNGLDKELKEIENRYNALRQKAKEAKLDAKEIERINSLERKEKVSAVYVDNSAQLQKRLEVEKALYEEYENAKRNFGKETAQAIYQNLIDTSRNYYDVVSSEMDKIDVKDMTAEERKRYALLTEMMLDYVEIKDKAEREALNTLLKETATIEERIYQLREEYLKKKKALEERYSGEVLAERMSFVDREYQAYYDALADEVLNNSGAFMSSLDIISTATRGQIEKQIKELNNFLDKNKEISSEQRKIVESIVSDLTNRLSVAQEDSKNSATGVVDSQIAETRRQLEFFRKERDKLNRDNEISYKEFLRHASAMDVAIKILQERLNMLNLDRIVALGQDLGDLGNQFVGFSNSIEMISPALSDVFNVVGQGLKIFESITKVISAIGEGLKNTGASSGNYWLAIAGSILEVVGGIAQVWSGIVEKQRRSYREFQQWQMDVYRGELEYQALLRQREYVGINKDGTDRKYQTDQLAVLEKQMQEVESEFNKQLKRLQDEGEYIGKRWRSKSFWRSKTKTDWESLEGFSYEEMEELYKKNKLEGEHKEWFEELQKLKEEYGDIKEIIEDIREYQREMFSGTTAQELANSISEGLASGKRSFEDFAADIEGFLRNAILSSLNYTFFGEQVAELQKALAEMMEDGSLTDADVKKFQDMYMAIVNDAQEAMDMLNQAGIDLSGGSSDANSLKGAIKGMTEHQADLLAGQMGGWRLAQLETNSILKTSFSSTLFFLSRQVGLQMQIEINTRSISEVTQKILDELKKNKTATMPTLINPNAALAANGLWTE